MPAASTGVLHQVLRTEAVRVGQARRGPQDPGGGTHRGSDETSLKRSDSCGARPWAVPIPGQPMAAMPRAAASAVVGTEVLVHVPAALRAPTSLPTAGKTRKAR